LIDTTDTLRGKGWTLVLRTRDNIAVSAGSGHSVITGSWVVVGGTGRFKGTRGGGRSATVVFPPDGFTLKSISRYEGFLTVG
jgi:hypothetical protein